MPSIDIIYTTIVDVLTALLPSAVQSTFSGLIDFFAFGIVLWLVGIVFFSIFIKPFTRRKS